MKINKNKIICSAICVLLSLTVLAGCQTAEQKPENTPTDTVKENVTGSITDKVDETVTDSLTDEVEDSETSYLPEETEKLYKALEKKGSIEIGLSSIPAALVGDSMDISNIRAKVYYNEGNAAFELGAQISGKAYDLNATFSEKEIAFRTSLLEKAYGINLNDAKKNIENNEYISELIGQVLGTEGMSISDLIDSFQNTLDSAKHFKDVAEDYLEKLKNIVNKICDIKKSLELGGAIVNFTVKVEDVTEIMTQLYGEFKNDAELRSFIENDFGELFQQVGISIEEIYNVPDEQIQSLVDQYTEPFKGYRLEGEIHVKSDQSFRNARFTVKDPSGNNFAKADIELEGDVKSVSVEYEGIIYSVSYEIKSDTDKEYNAVVSMTKKEGNTTGTVELFNVSYDKESKAYTSVIYVNDTPIEIKGIFEYSSTHARFAINSVTSNEQELFSGEFYVIVNSDDSIPSAISGYTDILTMKEEDFDELAEKLQAVFPSVEPDYESDDDAEL